jgi:hypothetical protein
MGGRAQPEAGADSPATLVYHAYKVHVEEELGARWWISVAAALGPNDAKHQAIEKAIDQGYLAVTALEVVSLDVRTA